MNWNYFICRPAILVITTLLLNACVPPRYLELQKLDAKSLRTAASDHDLCDIAVNWPAAYSAPMGSEISRRKLGDCTDDHFACVSRGQKLGSKGYLTCRTELEKIRVAQQLIYEAARQEEARQAIQQQLIQQRAMQDANDRFIQQQNQAAIQNLIRNQQQMQQQQSNPYNALIQGLGNGIHTNRPVNCRSNVIGGTVYTTCD